MPNPSSRPGFLRELDPPRIVAAALVLLAHVALLHTLHVAMSPGKWDEASTRTDETLTVEFMTSNPARSAVGPDAPAREPRPAARVSRSTARPARSDQPAQSAQSESTTSVYFVEDDPDVALPGATHAPRTDAADVFDPPAPHRPFLREPLVSSNLPKSLIRLPDRPSMMQAYWAVPEGENLQGRIARKVPIVGLLLAATGAIGVPHCPPKSEHPDCLERLINDLSP